jgi:hypothetical protein
LVVEVGLVFGLSHWIDPLSVLPADYRENGFETPPQSAASEDEIKLIDCAGAVAFAFPGGENPLGQFFT